jgi:class 3 adenylate cyclase/sugar lactone lactonase YvrE
MILAVSDVTSATATFLFTDIEGSTALLKSHRAEYSSILAEHHRLLRGAFTEHGGREVDNQGDSFFVAFGRAKNAVLAAAAAQRAISTHSWPGAASVRVRMGIHTGEADVAIDRYVGLSVHRAARISAIGHGGQVLISQSTASLLEDDEEDLPGIELRDLGAHHLKDIARPVRLYQLDVEGLPTAFPPLNVSRPPPRRRRTRAALAGAGLLLAGGVVAAVLTRGGDAAPTVVPNSLVRIDPETLEPTDVVPIGTAPDLVVAAGGFIWITHHVLRDVASGAARDAGDRTLTRVDPEAGEVVTVGGGLAPCGLAPDPSGDVWVANCFASGGQGANVVRVDATTLNFEATLGVPGGTGVYRGVAYGGGSLWLSEISGEGGTQVGTVTQLDPRSGKQRTIRIRDPVTALTFAEGYGDVWGSNFDFGTLTRIQASTATAATIDLTSGVNPGHIVSDGEVVWVGDWSGPQVARAFAVGPSMPRTVSLPARNPQAGVWNLAAGEGHIWATTPRDGTLWRIDPTTNVATRIELPHFPAGVTASADGLWVTVREG